MAPLRAATGIGRSFATFATFATFAGATSLVFGCQKRELPTNVPDVPSLVRPVATQAAANLDPDATHVVQIAISETHACARMANGTVRCWGDNSGGALGDGTPTERHIPVPVKGIRDAVDVVVGLGFSCARLTSGSVRCWGGTGFFRFDDKPDGAAPGLDPVELTEARGVVRIWAGGNEGCARWASSETKCWGTEAGFLAAGHPGAYGTFPHLVTRALASATDFSLHEALGCARLERGTVRCFGRNDRGQVGDGTTIERLVPAEVKGLSGVKQVAAGREFACALVDTGTVACWGGNDAGQLGDGTTHDRPTAAPVPGVRDVVELSSGSLHTCARHRDGRVSCWGWNHYGQLGNGVPSDSAGPQMIAGLAHVTQIAATDTHTCALQDDGNVACWGQGWRGVLGDGMQLDRAQPVAVKWSAKPSPSSGLPTGVHVRTVAVGAFHSCVGLDDGTVRCWGSNEMGMIVPGLDEAIPRPVVVPNLTGVASISLGNASAATLANGSVMRWGRTKSLSRANLQGVAQYVEGETASCVRFEDGRARCDGRGIASDATLTKVASIEITHATSCALLEDHTVMCAGYNGHGQLGDGSTTEERATFGPVNSLRDVVQIALGTEHACARLASGTVACWGQSTGAGNANGVQPIPTQVSGLSNVVDIAAGGNASCARLRDGTVKCWGQFEHSADQRGAASSVPVEVPWLRGASSLALGMFHSCALVADSVLCWGGNQYGELGDGTMDAHSVGAAVRW